MSSITPEAKAKLDKIMDDERRQTEQKDFKDLEARLNGGKPSANDDPPEQKEKSIISTDKHLEDNKDPFLDDLVERISDAEFAQLCIKTIEKHTGRLPCPQWFEVIDMFTGVLTAGDNKITVSVISHGAQNDMLLDTSIPKLEIALQEIRNEIEANPEEPNTEVIDKRNELIRQLSDRNLAKSYGTIIKDWKGPQFVWDEDQGGYKEGSAMPSPKKLLLELGAEKGREILIAKIRDLPHKLLTMITKANAYLNKVGVEDGWAQGN